MSVCETTINNDVQFLQPVLKLGYIVVKKTQFVPYWLGTPDYAIGYIEQYAISMQGLNKIPKELKAVLDSMNIKYFLDSRADHIVLMGKNKQIKE